MNCNQRLEAVPSSGAFLNKTVFLQISRFLDAVNAFSMLHMLQNQIFTISFFYITILSCLREDFQCKQSEFHMRLLRVLFGSPIFQGGMQIVSFAARHLTTESSFGAYETCQRHWLRLEIQITRKTLFHQEKLRQRALLLGVQKPYYQLCLYH